MTITLTTRQDAIIEAKFKRAKLEGETDASTAQAYMQALTRSMVDSWDPTAAEAKEELVSIYEEFKDDPAKLALLETEVSKLRSLINKA